MKLPGARTPVKKTDRMSLAVRIILECGRGPSGIAPRAPVTKALQPASFDRALVAGYRWVQSSEGRRQKINKYLEDFTSPADRAELRAELQRLGVTDRAGLERVSKELGIDDKPTAEEVAKAFHTPLDGSPAGDHAKAVIDRAYPRSSSTSYVDGKIIRDGKVVGRGRRTADGGLDYRA